MTRDEANERAVRYWMNKARECLAAAEDESRAGRFTFLGEIGDRILAFE